ncbi:MAG TPA: DotU family type IV/VI secretion system protein [Polyangiaceae bacterium]
MKHSVLGELIHVYDELRSAVKSASVSDQQTFDELAKNLRTRLGCFSPRVTSCVGEAQAQGVMAPLVFWLDEFTQRHWSCLGLHWPSLQYTEFGRQDGGDAFFEEATRLLQSEAPEPLVLVSYLLALREGFEGRYAEQPELLQSTRVQLASRLPEQRRDVRSQRCERLPRAKPAWVVWAPLVGLPLLVQILFAWAAAIW